MKNIQFKIIQQKLKNLTTYISTFDSNVDTRTRPIFNNNINN